jgi:site-specific DNA-cytosine methylase
MKTFASLFTGGGGADVGAAQAGYTHLWGVEYDPKIASVAELNGFSTLVSDVTAVDFSALAAPYWLHMSPPCTRASQANTNAEESPLDQALADACIRAIRTLRPRRISLENVWGYRTFTAFRSILAALTSEGYAVDYWHLNAADYGVPQTRKRLMLCASLDHQPRRPSATHTERRPDADQFTMFDAVLPPWRGWYAAIADLIPTLPDSQFAPWQLERLPAELKETMLVSGTDATIRVAADPMVTLTASLQAKTMMPRAFIVHPTNMQAMPVRDSADPMFTITAGGDLSARNMFTPRAFVVDCQESGSASGLTNREAGQPMYTLSATMEPRRPARAFIIGGGNTNTTEDRPRTPRYDDEPAFTISRSSDRDRAYVGRVVKMTPRCLARFNGLADSYRLPDSPTLACTVLGNMHMKDVQYAAMEANP